MKRRTRIGLVVAAIVCAATMTETAYAQEARTTRVDKPTSTSSEGRPLRRVTLTLDAKQAISFTPFFAVTSDVRVARKWSIAITGGGGARENAWPATGSKLAWQLGAEPRWYFAGDYNSGFYAAWSTTFVDSAGGRFGYESAAPPTGLSTGPAVGFKSVYVPIITPDVEVGVVRPLITPSAEGTPPLVAIVARFGIGFSL